MATYDMLVIDDYISSVVRGALDQDTFRKITDEMLVLCREKGIRKIVIDVIKTAGTFSQDDAIAFALYATEALQGHVDKYAYVYPHELLTYSSQKVAKGRGLNVQAFYDIDHALAWIEK